MQHVALHAAQLCCTYCSCDAVPAPQGDKTDWHIASGVVYKSKKLAPDEMAAMVDRLCVAKHKVCGLPLLQAVAAYWTWHLCMCLFNAATYACMRSHPRDA